MPLNLTSKAKVTWCPGCPNGGIMVAFRQALNDFANEGNFSIDKVVAAAGIGCHGKITDYLQMNTFTSLHGRVIPAMTGMKLANPDLLVVGFSGDGDSLSEGLDHLMHAAKRNSDIKLFMHDNQVFALTTGQPTALSPRGFKGRAAPEGTIEDPVNVLELMLAAGATFVARTYAIDIQKTKEVMKAAMRHKGFAFVDIIQPCITFYDTRDWYKDHSYWIGDDFPTNEKKKAMEKVTEQGEKVPLGIFYRVEHPTYEASLRRN